MVTAAGWLRERFGYVCRDAGLIEAALTHRSAASLNNERLEFLGDAVLSFVVADLLYQRFPAAPEGDLSRLRAGLVNGEVLAVIAAEIGLGDWLVLGGGELKSGGFRRRSILADAFEALLGAIYLDGGLEPARSVVLGLLEPRLSSLPTAEELKDPKTRLQEALQGRGLALPLYSVIAVSGEPHQQTFRVRCALPALELAAEASGSSRRRAEQEAARQVLDSFLGRGAAS
jgi:ribonuclease-3